jgi:hypothetical protein
VIVWNLAFWVVVAGVIGPDVVAMVQTLRWHERRVLFGYKGQVYEGELCWTGLGKFCILASGEAHLHVRMADRGKTWIAPGDPRENVFKTHVVLRGDEKI